MVCGSSSGEVVSEDKTAAEDSVDSVCGFKGASDVKRESAKKQTEALSRQKRKEREKHRQRGKRDGEGGGGGWLLLITSKRVRIGGW